MYKDPYSVLGVSRAATDEQIKSAYRDLARRYHPDNYTDAEQARLAGEKMKEINEAYDEIRRGRSDTDAPRRQSSEQHSPILAQVRQHIRAGRFDDADGLLGVIPEGERGAEWNFLKGCVLTQKGWYFDAQKYLEIACYMDPENREYREFLNNIRSAASTYGGGYRTDAPGSRSDACDICASLACLDCMCECCGGDFIRCC